MTKYSTCPSACGKQSRIYEVMFCLLLVFFFSMPVIAQCSSAGCHLWSASCSICFHKEVTKYSMCPSACGKQLRVYMRSCSVFCFFFFFSMPVIVQCSSAGWCLRVASCRILLPEGGDTVLHLHISLQQTVTCSSNRQSHCVITVRSHVDSHSQSHECHIVTTIFSRVRPVSVSMCAS